MSGPRPQCSRVSGKRHKASFWILTYKLLRRLRGNSWSAVVRNLSWRSCCLSPFFSNVNSRMWKCPTLFMSKKPRPSSKRDSEGLETRCTVWYSIGVATSSNILEVRHSVLRSVRRRTKLTIAGCISGGRAVKVRDAIVAAGRLRVTILCAETH